MNHDENNTGPQPWIDPALEARVVASVLGETSAFEAEELERILAGNPELAIFKRRIEAVHALVEVAARPQQSKMRMSPERRQKLLEIIGPASPAEKARIVVLSRPSWWSPHFLIRLAACLVMGVIVAAFFASGFRHEPAVRESADFQESASLGVAGNASGYAYQSADDKAKEGSEEQMNFAVSAPSSVSAPDLAGNNSYTGATTLQAGGLAVRGASASTTIAAPQANVAQGGVSTGSYVSQGVVTEVVPQPAATPESQTLAMTGAAPSRGAGRDGAARELKNLEKALASTADMLEAVPREQAGKVPVDKLNDQLSHAEEALASAGELKAMPADEVQPLQAFAEQTRAFAPAVPSSRPVAVHDGETVVMAQLETLPQKQEALAELKSDLRQNETEQIQKFKKSGEPVDALQVAQQAAAESDGKFDGFINYGSPITPAVPPSGDIAGKPMFRGEVAKEVADRAATAASADADLQASAAAAQPMTAGTPVTSIKAFTGGWGKGSGSGTGVRAKDSTGVDAYGSGGTLKKAEAVELSSSLGEANAAGAKEGESLMNAPTVTTMSGERAEVQVVREFPYPDESNIKERVVMDQAIAVPSTPTAFETRPAEMQAGNAAQPLLAQAQAFYDAGRFDLAAKRYEQTLGNDPSNLEARKGLEAVNAAKAKYADQAFNETRRDMTRQVDKSWELPVTRFAVGASTVTAQPALPARDAAAVNRKLDEIIIPRLDFRDATVSESLEFIKQRAASLDVSEQQASRKGINIVLKAAPPESEARVTLSMTNVPLRAAVDYVAKAANMKLKVEPHAVAIVPQGEGVEAMLRKTNAPQTQYQNEILASKQPFSTFSLHVSDVSFQLAKDALAKGAMPESERIRPEEFYNAFDYNDPSPAAGEEVACRIEQCAHPFLQQRDLVRIALKVAAAGRAAGQPLRLTILLDTSGSMEREDRAVSVRRALQTLATLLGPNDRVTLIGFARTPRLLAEEVRGDQAGKLVEIADRTPSEGGTNLELALDLASEMALKQKLPNAQNRVVLLTDGAANLGNANPARLARQIERTRQQGISFDACGVGANGLNDEMLEALTRKGDGRYYLINKPEDADAGFARQLAGALRPAAENVKVQVVFNPARVSKYRLIGFEKHQLKREDFRNDKVQAAELSAEEAGVALYQLETLPEGDGELGQVFVRFRDPANGAMVERSWTMPYDSRNPAYDQASPSMQLAATAALLAERLRGDVQIDLNTLTPVITNLRGEYPDQVKVRELIRMFEQVKQ